MLNTIATRREGTKQVVGAGTYTLHSHHNNIYTQTCNFVREMMSASSLFQMACAPWLQFLSETWSYSSHHWLWVIGLLQVERRRGRGMCLVLLLFKLLFTGISSQLTFSRYRDRSVPWVIPVIHAPEIRSA